jgi:hypothetical protein
MASLSLDAPKPARRARPPQPSTARGLLRMIGLVSVTVAAIVAAIWLRSHRSCEFVVCRLDASPATTGLATAPSSGPVRKP